MVSGRRARVTPRQLPARAGLLACLPTETSNRRSPPTFLSPVRRRRRSCPAFRPRARRLFQARARRRRAVSGRGRGGFRHADRFDGHGHPVRFDGQGLHGDGEARLHARPRHHRIEPRPCTRAIPGTVLTTRPAGASLSVWLCAPPYTPGPRSPCRPSRAPWRVVVCGTSPPTGRPDGSKFTRIGVKPAGNVLRAFSFSGPGEEHGC